MLELLVVFLILFWFIASRQRANEARFRALESEIAALRTALALPAAAPEQAVDESIAAPVETVETIEETQPEIAALAEPEPPASAPETPARDSDTLESWLGGRWAVWVGGVALALGGIFLAKYSIESGLLSPAVRLSMAALFGLLLFAAGEVVRRRQAPDAGLPFRTALIPGILTAAGAVTLFGVIYIAYAFYAYLGPLTAFLLLAAVGLATLGLSLMHGQALAGLGLAGSMLTPALIASTAPNIAALFAFLTLCWVATAFASRLKGWTLVPSLGNLGLGLWALAYIASAPVLETAPLTLCLLVMIAGLIFIWPGTAFSPAPEPEAPQDVPTRFGSWAQLLARPPLSPVVTGASAAVLPALALAATPAVASLDPVFCFAALIVTLAAYGAARVNAVWAALLAGAGATGGAALLAFAGLAALGLGLATPEQGVPLSHTTEIAASLGLGVAFILLGCVFLNRHGREEPQFSALWAALMAVVPMANAVISFVNFGNLTFDALHGVYGIACAVALLAIAEWHARREDAQGRSAVMNWLVLGGFSGILLALQALTSGVATLIGIAVTGFAFVMAARLRPWAALPWMMGAAGLIVLARIAADPTIVGAANLGKTPVFNALAAGYGIPALLTALAAFELRAWPGTRIRNLLQALASLMVFLTVAILIRHAMNGGTLTSDAPSLGEQSIYTLLTIGLSICLMSLDLRSPSPVFRYGSMIAGGLSMLSILGAHLLTLNPYLTGEDTGRWPFFNLLLIGYLLPAIAYAGLAVYARGRRPPVYVALAAITGLILGFAWATLSVRRIWQGENIAAWKGFLAGETYSYSVVWLLIGIGLLGLGSKFDARSLRIASAALVMITVAKVFLIDMSNLEGVLRALSFIGLGVVLIGIGLFYQRILTRRGKAVSPQTGES